MRISHRRSVRRQALAAALLAGSLGMAGPAVAAPSPGPTPEPTAVTPAADPTVRVTAPKVTNGFNQPTGVYAAKDGSNRLFILEKAGRVKVFNQVTGARSTFVDLTDRVSTEGERGLLGMAFDPAFKTNGFVYLAFTTADAQLQVTRFRTFNGSNGMALNKATATRIITVPHPTTTSNHYAGHLEFGPDGLLYISTGDGATTMTRNAVQRPDNLYGKILRIDVRTPANGRQYSIPPSNPYATGGGRPEVFLRGMRNPFAFSVNDNGEVIVGDVGQATQEEVTLLQPSQGGANLGWPCMEGTVVYDQAQCTAVPGPRVPPTTSYGRNLGRSVTGGAVYQGSRFPALDGLYVFGDFATGRLFLLDRATGQRFDKGILLPLVTGFGESDARELYAVTIDGTLRQIKAG